MKNFLKINRALVAKKKITFLFALLCASVMGWATDYCHTEMSAGGKTIYLTCQEVSAGNYQLKVECDEAMSGLGGSFCEVNGVGGYQLNAAGHFTLAADGKTITCDIASSTKPNVYTPLYVLIDGEKNFGSISDASWASCGGSTPEPTGGEKFVAANASENSTYFATGDGWTADTESSASYNNSTGVISINLVPGRWIQWQAQYKLNLGFEYKADKYYDFSITFHANKEVPQVTLKTNNNNALFYEDQSITIPEDDDYTYTKTDVAGVAGDNIFVFDFGHAAAGTEIEISDISIIEKDEPSTPVVVPDPNDYTAGGHTIHLDAYYVNDIYTLNITSTDDMQGLGGSFWNVNGVGTDMRSNAGTNSYTVSGDKKTITCQVQSSSAPNIYTPLYVLMPGEINFGNVTLNWEDRTPINSEYCNALMSSGNTQAAFTWETDDNGNVNISIIEVLGGNASDAHFRGHGIAAGKIKVGEGREDVTTYFTHPGDIAGQSTLTLTLTDPANAPAPGTKIYVENQIIEYATSKDGNAWPTLSFVYSYGGICNQLEAPTNVAVDADSVITFDAVAGATTYTAYVSLGGVEKYHQEVTNGGVLHFWPYEDGAYKVAVIVSGEGKTDSELSDEYTWNLLARAVVLGNSEYCEHIKQTGTNTEAAFTWETDANGNIIITISETLGGATSATHFRNNAFAIGNFKVGAGQAAGANYFSHPGTTTGNQLVLTATNAPALGEKIYYHGVVEYATSGNGDAWPTLDFEWTYGTVCSGKAVSATPNNNTMGTAVVKQGDDEVTSVEEGTSVTFIATSADAELYRFVNWTKGGVVVSTSATYVTTITESTNLIANFDYIRNTYCHTEINSVQNKKLYLTLGSIGGGQYQIKIEGSAEAKLTGLNNANYTINWVTTDIVDGDKNMSGQDVPFNNARWTFSADGYGSATMTFGISEGKTWEDIYVWNHAIYFMTAEGEVGYTGFPDRYHIAWTETCADAEAPVFTKTEGFVLDANTVRLAIEATDNWAGMLTYTIARAGAEPIISNHASGEEFAQEITGLTPGTEYDFTVTVSDGVNNANAHIIVTPEGDATNPVMGEASLASKTWNSAVINVAATDNIGVTAYYVVELDAEFVPTEGKITVEGLTQATEYTLHIKAKDAAGNMSDIAAEVSFTTDTHLLAPTTAPAAPTWDAAWVMSIYSEAYAQKAAWGFLEGWGQTTTKTDMVIAGNNVMKYSNFNYLGWQSAAPYNAINMEKLHLDIWVADDCTIGIVPIYGGTGLTTDDSHRAKPTLNGQQWNSIDLDLATDYNGLNLASIFQFKFDQATTTEFFIDNVYFYRTSELTDTEAPTNVSATVAAEGFYSVTITAQAEDNMGAVNFSVMNGETEVATGSGASGEAVTITVIGLTAGTNYNFNLIAKDDKPNAAAPVAIAATTKTLPDPAPVPATNGKVVVNVFSDAMEGSKTIHSGGWGESTQVEWLDIVPGDKVFYAQNFNWAGWHSWGADVNVTEMQYLHVDIYSTGMKKISFTPVSHDPTNEGNYVIDLTPNAWTSVDIPLSAYPSVELNKIFQFKFMNPVDGNEFMADNVYFWSYGVKTNVDKWSTFASPVAVQVPSDVTAYKAVYSNANGDEVLELTASDGIIPANTGVLLKGEDASTEYAFTVTDATSTTDWTDNSLVGCAVRTDISTVAATNDIFCLRHSDLFNQTAFFLYSGQYIPAGKAYLALPKDQGGSNNAPQRRVRFVFNNEQTATGVESVQPSDISIQKVMVNGVLYIIRGEAVYTIQGARMK